jgi:hypothetical protein
MLDDKIRDLMETVIPSQVCSRAARLAGNGLYGRAP